jgi:hypothetical protein
MLWHTKHSTGLLTSWATAGGTEERIAALAELIEEKKRIKSQLKDFDMQFFETHVSSDFCGTLSLAHSTDILLNYTHVLFLPLPLHNLWSYYRQCAGMHNNTSSAVLHAVVSSIKRLCYSA